MPSKKPTAANAAGEKTKAQWLREGGPALYIIYK